MLRKIIANLTPKKAWDIYVSTSEKLFLSNFKFDNPPIYATELKKMCDRYAIDLSGSEDTLFTTGELNHLSDLLVEHLEGYIKNKGGLDKVEYYTEEELDEIAKKETEEIFETMARRYGTDIETIRLALRISKERRGVTDKRKEWRGRNLSRNNLHIIQGMGGPKIDSIAFCTVITTLCTKLDASYAYKNIEANHMDIKNEGINGVIVWIKIHFING